MPFWLILITVLFQQICTFMFWIFLPVHQFTLLLHKSKKAVFCRAETNSHFFCQLCSKIYHFPSQPIFSATATLFYFLKLSNFKISSEKLTPFKFNFKVYRNLNFFNQTIFGLFNKNLAYTYFYLYLLLFRTNNLQLILIMG